MPEHDEPYDRKKHGRGRKNKDGTYSTEKSSTHPTKDGKWRNAPSIWWSGKDKHKQLKSDDEVSEKADKYEKRTGKKFSRYKTEKEASAAARRRSKQRSEVRRTIAGEHAVSDKKSGREKMD